MAGFAAKTFNALDHEAIQNQTNNKALTYVGANFTNKALVRVFALLLRKF